VRTRTLQAGLSLPASASHKSTCQTPGTVREHTTVADSWHRGAGRLNARGARAAQDRRHGVRASLELVPAITGEINQRLRAHAFDGQWQTNRGKQHNAAASPSELGDAALGERASSTYSLLRRPWETNVHVRRRLLVHVVPYVLGPRVLDQLLTGRTTIKMVTPALGEQKWAHAAGTPQRAGQGHPPRFRTCPCPCTACSPQALHTPVLDDMSARRATGDARTGGATAHG
jgi:hypothetical protein